MQKRYGCVLVSGLLLGCGPAPVEPPPPPPAPQVVMANPQAVPAPSSPLPPVSVSPPASNSLPSASGATVVKPSELNKADLAAYQGRTIESTGTIYNLSLEGNSVILEDVGSSEDGYLFSLEPSVKDPMATYATGQVLTVRGREIVHPITEERRWVFAIVDAKPNPAPILHAADLAKEFQANADKTDAKYGGRTLYVIGEVLQYSDMGRELVIKGDDKLEIRCSFAAWNERGQKLDLKPGAPVQIQGRYVSSSGDDNVVQIADYSLVVTPLPVAGVAYGKEPERAEDQ